MTNTKPSKSPPPNAKDDSEVNIGLVVGASVGGFVFLLIVGISIFFLLRRRKRRRRPRELVHHEVNILGDDYEPTAPVTLPQHLTPLSTSDHFTGTTMATMSAPSHQSGPLKLYVSVHFTTNSIPLFTSHIRTRTILRHGHTTSICIRIDLHIQLQTHPIQRHQAQPLR